MFRLGKCPACARFSPHPIRLGEVPLTHHGTFSRESYDLLMCRRCEVVHLDPIPSARDLDHLYRESEQFTDPVYTDPERISASLEYYGHCLDDLGLMPESGQHSLEVGAGLSWVSRAIKQRSSEVVTHAQDVSGECVGQCPWVDHYHVAEVDDLDHSRTFSLISLTHVIEHLPDPLNTLGEIAGRLDRSGQIFITAPYRPSGWAKGHDLQPWLDYSYMHVPAHICYLSEKWFRHAADLHGLSLTRWDPSHEDGQVFEVILERIK